MRAGRSTRRGRERPSAEERRAASGPLSRQKRQRGRCRALCWTMDCEAWTRRLSKGPPRVEPNCLPPPSEVDRSTQCPHLQKTWARCHDRAAARPRRAPPRLRLLVCRLRDTECETETSATNARLSLPPAQSRVLRPRACGWRARRCAAIALLQGPRSSELAAEPCVEEAIDWVERSAARFVRWRRVHRPFRSIDVLSACRARSYDRRQGLPPTCRASRAAGGKSTAEAEERRWTGDRARPIIRERVG